MERVSGVRGMMERFGLPGMALWGFILSMLVPVFVWGEFIPNDPPPSPLPPPPANFQLGFDPDDYQFLVYDGGDSENLMQRAMEKIGITTFTVRSPGNPVTINDLATHDILIVGWTQEASNMAGLDPNVLAAGIKGRILLSGHDSNYHTLAGPAAGMTLFSQSIEYILAVPFTGLFVCAESSNPAMTWLPDEWEITATRNSGQTITTFTSQGLASGIFDGLIPDDMCNWGVSYHNTFTAMGPDFVEFEKGGANGEEVITIARVSSEVPKVSKSDDVEDEDCVSPGDEITYTITVDPAGEDHAWVIVTDTLPMGVDYDAVMGWSPPSLDPQYDPEAHTYTWELGALDAEDDPVVLTLTVMVNGYAEPSGVLLNQVWAESDIGMGYASESTPVCCWDTGGIIFVDDTATGANIGTSWRDAYTDLQDAIDRADKGCGDAIWIARGTYKPGNRVTDTFKIPDNVSVYGGFRGGEYDPNDRRPREYVTILTGIGSPTTRNETVVTMGDDTLLDGVTVKEAKNSGQGILADGVTYTLSNCVIEDNLQYGIRGLGCDATIKWCIIRNNIFHGIFQSGIGNVIAIENCYIQDNQQYGVYLEDSISTMNNSAICRNGNSDPGYFGIRVKNPQAIPNFHNNTIAYNRNAGISYVDNDPSYVNKPDIQNCILWYNNLSGNGEQQAGYKVTTHYSCVYDPNDPAGTSTTLDANYNFSHKPDFAYINEPNNVHLAANSFCINKGNPSLSYTGQLDIDGEDRVMGNYVDVGADEVNPECDDVYHPLDWNADGVVNYGEFEKFSRAWMTYDPNNPLCDPNHPNFVSDPNSINFISQTDKDRFNPQCDLDEDLDVDLGDLAVLYDESNWLWVACWRLDLTADALQQMMSMSSEGGMQMESLSTLSVEKTTAILPEKSVKEQIFELKDTIVFLEKLWLEDPSIQQEIDPVKWQQFMSEVYNAFSEIILNTQTFDLPEEIQ